MKLADWARKHGINYQTAVRWFKTGTLPVKAMQTATGTILVEEEEEVAKPDNGSKILLNDIRLIEEQFNLIYNALPHTVIDVLNGDPKAYDLICNLAVICADYNFNKQTSSKKKSLEDFYAGAKSKTVLSDELKTAIKEVILEVMSSQHSKPHFDKWKNFKRAAEVEKKDLATPSPVDLVENHDVKMLNINGYEVPDPESISIAGLTPTDIETLRKIREDMIANVNSISSAARDAALAQIIERTNKFQKQKPSSTSMHSFRRHDNSKDQMIDYFVAKIIGKLTTEEINGKTVAEIFTPVGYEKLEKLNVTQMFEEMAEATKDILNAKEDSKRLIAIDGLRKKVMSAIQLIDAEKKRVETGFYKTGVRLSDDSAAYKELKEQEPNIED